MHLGVAAAVPDVDDPVTSEQRPSEELGFVVESDIDVARRKQDVNEALSDFLEGRPKLRFTETPLQDAGDTWVEVELFQVLGSEAVDGFILLVLGVPAGEQHADEQAEGVDVGPVVVAVAGRLFRRAEYLGAHTAAELVYVVLSEDIRSLGHEVDYIAGLAALYALGEAEVTDFADPLKVYEDILHLQISVNDLACVDALDAVDQLQHYLVVFLRISLDDRLPAPVHKLVQALFAKLRLDVDGHFRELQQPLVVD